MVPLNQRALPALGFWAQQCPNRKPEHYVFPLEKCIGFTGNLVYKLVYKTDPTQPIGDVKEAWEGAKRRTRRHCPNCKTGIMADKEKPETGHFRVKCKCETKQLSAGLMAVRFHDLRHSAVSRMIAARGPLPIIAKIVGWAVKLAARYGHFGIKELRGAVEAITSKTADGNVLRAGSLKFSLQSRSEFL